MKSDGVERVQDSVHGLMEFRGRAASIVDLLRTRELQRLRRVRQLGLGYLVFPGAEHSRLSHSLGAAFLATRFGAQLRHSAAGYLSDLFLPDENVVRDFAVAALCHDVGHGPMSHAWEREIIGGKNLAGWIYSLGLDSSKLSGRKVAWHELVGQAFLSWEEGDLHGLLETFEGGLSGRISGLLRGEYYLPYLCDLLSGAIDVDRADFLLRDAYMCGVGYGRFDLNWLVSVCTIGLFEGRYVVGFDAGKSLRVIEQFLTSRRAMYETVYFHKTVRCAEGMMGMFLRRLKLAEAQKLKGRMGAVGSLVELSKGEPCEPEKLLRLDDFSMMSLVEAVADEKGGDRVLKDLASRILSRNLFKRVRCTSEQVESFLMGEGTHEALYRTCASRLTGDVNDAKFYVVIDQTKFSPTALSYPEGAFFVELGGDRKAEPIFAHEALQHYKSPPAKRNAIFVPTEVRDDVEKLVGASASGAH